MRKLEDAKEFIRRRRSNLRTDNIMVKRKGTKRQTMVVKILLRKLKIGHIPHKNPEVNTGAQ